MTVFADGPTRVLRFADVLDQGAEEAEQSILDLAARLRQVEEQLWRVNASFSALHGASGARTDPGNAVVLPFCADRYASHTSLHHGVHHVGDHITLQCTFRLGDVLV